MNPQTLTTITAVGAGALSLGAGIWMGAMPSTAAMTADQRKVSSAVGFIVAMAFLLLTVAGQDAASWTMLVAAIAGFVLGRIPPLRRRLAVAFPGLAEQSAHPARKPRKESTGTDRPSRSSR